MPTGSAVSGPPSVTARAIASMMNREHIDVAYSGSSSTTGPFRPDSIARLFAPQMPYFVYRAGQAVLSRFPIVDHRYVRFPDSGNDYLQADVKVGDDTVRIFSVHLQTSGISGLQQRFRKDHGRDVPVERVIGELGATAVSGRSRSADPCGDRLHALSGHRGRGFQRHSFVLYLPPAEGRHDRRIQAVGNGFGGTFRYLGGVLRIDYIFYDDRFAGVGYYMPQDDVSDHKAVVAELRFRRI